MGEDFKLYKLKLKVLSPTFIGSGEEYADVESFKIVSNPGNGKTGDVEAEYSVSQRIPVGYDPETGRTEYDYDTEYRKGTFQVKLKNR